MIRHDQTELRIWHLLRDTVKRHLSLVSPASKVHKPVLNLLIHLMNRIREYFTWNTSTTSETRVNTLDFSSVKSLLLKMCQDILFLVSLDRSGLCVEKERETFQYSLNIFGISELRLLNRQSYHNIIKYREPGYFILPICRVYTTCSVLSILLTF